MAVVLEELEILSGPFRVSCAFCPSRPKLPAPSTEPNAPQPWTPVVRLHRCLSLWVSDALRPSWAYPSPAGYLQSYLQSYKPRTRARLGIASLSRP